MSETTIDGEVTAEEDVSEEVASAELAVRDAQAGPVLPPATMPSPREWDAMRAMADTICRTQFVPSNFRGQPEAVLAAILTGRELGIGPMQSLKDISIIDGRPALSANLMLAQMRKGGITIIASESSDARASITARRPDGETMTVEWTLEEAQRAGLVKDKSGWTKYPADMLWARCVGRLGRRLGGDVLAGMKYTAEEVSDLGDDELDSYTAGPIIEQRLNDAGLGVKVPQSWAEWADRFAKVIGGGESGKAEAVEWLREALQEGWKVTQRSELTAAQGKEASVKLNAVLLALEEGEHGDLAFDTDLRGTVAKAFAAKMDGMLLAGPPWRLSPSESTLPTHAEWLTTWGEDAGDAAAPAPAPASAAATVEDGSRDTPDVKPAENG